MTALPTRPREGLPAVLIEAFTRRPCAGNGAAVVLLERPQPAAWMQAVARSLRQSETAFLLRAGEQWLLRWFTPACEVPLCGHATLAALLALGHWGALAVEAPVHFRTRSGLLTGVRDDREPWQGSIHLPGGELRPLEPPEALERLVHGRLGCRIEGFWTSALGYRVALLPASADLAAMACLAPALVGEERGGLVLMQPWPKGRTTPPVGTGNLPDYQLRFFAPGLGIDEDPVTGSAHALVAPYWMDRLGRSRVEGWQCSDRPGGMVCEAGSSAMIRLIGSGHLLWDGTLRASLRHGDVPSQRACAEPQAPWRAEADAWASWLALEADGC